MIYNLYVSNVLLESSWYDNGRIVPVFFLYFLAHASKMSPSPVLYLRPLCLTNRYISVYSIFIQK